VKIEINIAARGRSKWYEYLVRFAFGGAVTALAGVIAKRYGPGVGGLFLAFPAIFPATPLYWKSMKSRRKSELWGRTNLNDLPTGRILPSRFDIVHIPGFCL
jgi:Protein of unknown function (DUF3147)